MTMKDLIEALNIFLKYGNKNNPTHCEHDVLTVDIDPRKVSEEDTKRLKALGFMPDLNGEYGGAYFFSYRFGSC